MHVLIDGQFLNAVRRGCAPDRATCRLIEQLVTSDITRRWFVAVADKGVLAALSPQARERIRPLLVPAEFPGHDSSAATAAYARIVQRLCAKHEVSLYWHLEPLREDVLLPLALDDVQLVVSISMPLPQKTGQEASAAGGASATLSTRLRDVADAAAAMICGSQAARASLLRHAPHAALKLHAIPPGVDHHAFAPTGADARPDQPYLLLVAAGATAAELQTAWEAFARLAGQRASEGSPLALRVLEPLPPQPDESAGATACLAALAQRWKLADRLQYAPGTELATRGALLAQAQACVIAGLLCGGEPALESLACGVPVIAPQGSPAAELAGEHAVYYPPGSSADLARAISAAMDTPHPPATRQAWVAHARQFDWPTCAHQHMRLFDRLHTPLTLKSLPRRLRVGVATPWPPQRTGIADYSQLLVARLRQHCDLELYVEDPSECRGERFGLPLRPIRALSGELGRLDTVLYQLGNNPDFHREIYCHAWQHPGVAVLHDYSIHGFLVGAFRGTSQESLLQAAQRFEGYTPPSRRSCDADVLEHPLCGAIVARSRGVVVHSAWAADQLAGVGRVRVIPHGAACLEGPSESERLALRRRFGIRDEELAIAVLGFVNKYKRLPSVLAALHALREAGHAVRLIVAGQIFDPSLGIAARIEQLGLQQQVTLTGYLSEHEFLDVIRLADVIVNLRCPSVGESSGTLARALGMGKPCLVSRYQQFTELPDDVCWKADVDEAEVPQLVAYLECMIRRPEVRRQLGRNARQYIRLFASWELAAELYAAFLHEVCQDALMRALPSAA
jgi:glycosyltransferase involved in cell wall biosynthesis